MEIIYEPHPVSAERKAELRAQGLTIIDAAFKPVDEAQESEAQSESTSDAVEPKKRGRPAKE